MQSIGRAVGSKALYLLSECARNSQEKNFPPMVSSHSESTKVKLTHPTEIQKSMEVKRRKEAKKQNDFCGGKRHIATFQTTGISLSLADQGRLGIDRKLLSQAVRRDGSGPGTFNGIGERKARSAPSNEFKSSTKEQYPLRHIQRDGVTAATTPKYGAKLFVHARADVRSRSIETAMRRLTSNDRNGAISYWIFENKISSFRKLQDLSNGIFAFKIGLEMTSNEVRKTT